MGLKASTIGLAAAIALGLDAGAHASIVTNGGFETGDLAGWSVSGDTGWTGVTATAAHSGLFGAFFGEDAPGSSISQTLSTVAGATYRVEFWLQLDASDAPNSFAWSWDDVVQPGSISDGSSLAYTHYSMLLTASGSATTLRFSFINPSSFYLLDDVAVTVPEPASLALALGALAGLGFTTRRRGGSHRPAAAGA